MKISIVLPNYNGEESLRKNLPAVLETGADEVIVVDDASTDGSVPELRSQNSKLKTTKIKVIENEKNLGFSSTVNRGVKEAKGEIVVLLNTDVSPEPNFLKPLVSHFTNPEVFAVGCLDQSPENGKIIYRGRGVANFKQGFLVHARGKEDKTDTFWVAGGSGAFRRQLWEKLGGFDEIYNPFYWEDIDLSYRAMKAGYQIFFEPQSVVTHQHEEGAIKKNYSHFQVKTIAYRNQFFFVWKNITDWEKRLSHLFWLPYHLTKALISLDLAFILGFLLAFFKLPLVVKSSFAAQKLFLKKDKEILG